MGLLARLRGNSKPIDEELDRNVEEEIARHLWVCGTRTTHLLHSMSMFG